MNYLHGIFCRNVTSEYVTRTAHKSLGGKHYGARGPTLMAEDDDGTKMHCKVAGNEGAK